MTISPVLRTAIGRHAYVEPLRDGRVTSDLLQLDFVDIEPLPKAFRAFVNGADLDVSELAVVTYLLARDRGRPIQGIAIPLWSRLPHTNLICPTDSGIASPSDLNGRTVGVRAYAQTSGVWVRGILAHEYGVDLDSICWGTMEDAHLPEFVDPPNSRRYPATPPLRELMLTGEFAAIMGERTVDPSGIRTVIPDATAQAREWIARTGIEPINHILAVRDELVHHYPWLPAELARMFNLARSLTEGGDTMPPPYGLAHNERSLQRCFDYAYEQAVVPMHYSADELFIHL